MASSDFIVACVYRTGGQYGPEHVARMMEQVREHHPHAYVACLTDAPRAIQRTGATAVPLKHKWPGWWSKIELFRVHWGMPVVYLDLDVTVVAPLGPLVRDGLTLATDALWPDRANSSVMAWNGHPMTIYSVFAVEPEKWQSCYQRCPNIGDQAFIERVARPSKFAPQLVVSYRKHCAEGVPPGAVVVSFHGKPKPWDVPEVFHRGN